MRVADASRLGLLKTVRKRYNRVSVAGRGGATGADGPRSPRSPNLLPKRCLMAKTGIIVGLFLCGLTVVSLFETPQKAVTQFVPMMFGIPVLFLGVVSLNPHRRPVSTWFAGALAALGLVLGMGRLLILGVESLQGDPINMLSVQTLLAMIATCLLFVLGVCVWHRRRNRRRQRRSAVSRYPDPTATTAEENHPASPDHSADSDNGGPTTQNEPSGISPETAETRTSIPATPSCLLSGGGRSESPEDRSTLPPDQRYATTLTDHPLSMDHSAPSAPSNRNS